MAGSPRPQSRSTARPNQQREREDGQWPPSGLELVPEPRGWGWSNAPSPPPLATRRCNGGALTGSRSKLGSCSGPCGRATPLLQALARCRPSAPSRPRRCRPQRSQSGFRGGRAEGGGRTRSPLLWPGLRSLAGWRRRGRYRSSLGCP